MDGRNIYSRRFNFFTNIAMEGKKLKELYEYLDGYSFVNYDEVEACVNDFFVENYEILEPSYGDLFFYHELAIHYISDRGLEFEEDIVNGVDVNHVEEWKKEVLSYNQSKNGSNRIE